MSKLILFTVLFFILSSSVYGQEDIKRDIERYYLDVSNAEKMIISSNVDSAVYYYDLASSYHRPFLTDCYNALLASCATHNTNMGMKMLKIMVEKGISIEFFKTNKIFSYITSTSQWKDFEESDPKPQFNKELQRYILNLLKLDQEFRYDYLQFSDTIRKIDFFIAEKMDSLFTKYGYLSEDLVGAFQEDEKVLPKGWTPLDIILIHQVKMFRTKYTYFFENEVLKGNMQNSVFISHAKNFSTDSSYLFRCFYSGMGDIHQVGDRYLTCGTWMENKINLNRSRVYYPPLSHTINRFKYGLSHPDSPFLLGFKALCFPDITHEDSINKLYSDLTSQGYIEILLNSLDDD